MGIPLSISVFNHHRPSDVSVAAVQYNFHVHKHDILKVEDGISIRSRTILAQIARRKYFHNLFGVVWRWSSSSPAKMVADTVKISHVVGA